jgi:hypothetical protein
MEMRLGGIYTLERLASETLTSAAEEGTGPDLYRTVMETLTAFVRERAKWKAPEFAAPEIATNPQPDARPDEAQLPPSPLKPATDITAVLDVIRRRPVAGRERETLQEWRLDLNGTDLRGADLGNAHFERADLHWAHLGGVFLRNAHLEGAFLLGTRLEGAMLRGAHLEEAKLFGTHLEGAFLRDAHFEGAIFTGTHLDGTDLSEAHLAGVDLNKAYGNTRTRLPDGVERPAGWPAYEPA